ncbi:MAG: hypothetical protein AAFQ94_31240 [Bacteroidota bacterium]
MKNIIIILFIFATSNLLAQPSVRALKKYMEEAKKGSYKTAPASIFKDDKNADKLINSSAEYLSDSVDRIRNKAYSLIKLIGLSSTDQSARAAAVDILVDGISDKNKGIAGGNINALTEYKRADFDNPSKSKLANLLNAGAPNIDKLAKLIGYLNIISASSDLKSILATNTHYKNKWAIRLALARMEDQEAIDYLTNKLESAPVGDDFIYDIVPDLIYTRQEPVFDFIEDIINSEELNCQSADPDSNTKILCGYRVLEYIAYSIDNFPIAVDDYGVAIINDYEDALVEVRRWFANNPNYQLNKEIY